MVKKPGIIHFVMILMMISTLGYVISNSYENQWISNILSPIATLMSGVLISMTLKTQKLWVRAGCF